MEDSSRARKFNETFDYSKFRKDRMQSTLELRKSKRAEEVFNKRQIHTEKNEELKLDPATILELIQAKDQQSVIKGLIFLEKVLENEVSIEFVEICVYEVVGLISCKDQTIELQSSITLACISTSSYSSCLIRWVPSFISLLLNSDTKIQENIYWLLGNISLDSENTRNKILIEEFLQVSSALIQANPTPTVAKKICWCISHCCKGKFNNNFQYTLPFLSYALEQNIIEIFPDVLWALSNITEYIKSPLASTQILPIVVKLTKIDFIKIQHPALRIIGNMLNGSDDDTDFMVGLGAVRCLILALESKNKKIRQEAMWAFSNLSTGKHVQDIVERGLFKRIIDLAITDCIDIQKEAVWTLFYAIFSSNNTSLSILIDEGILSAICCLLNIVDIRSKLILLKGLSKVLQRGEEFSPNPYVCILESNGGKETIEMLANGHNNKITIKSFKILQEYFEGISENMELLPTSTFAF